MHRGDKVINNIKIKEIELECTAINVYLRDLSVMMMTVVVMNTVKMIKQGT